MKFLKLILCAWAFVSVSSVFAEQHFKFGENWWLEAGGNVIGNLRTADSSFDIKDIPRQNVENQPSSAAAYSPDLLSVRLGFGYKNRGSLHVRVDYPWLVPIQLNIYPLEVRQGLFQIRDLYALVSFQNGATSFWLGRRTIEFSKLNLFQVGSPFDQIDLQGIGFENQIIQAGVGVSRGTVSTTAYNSAGTLITDTNGNLTLFPKEEYIASAFVAGKLLFAEGFLFQPIFAMRVYFGTRASAPNSAGDTERGVSHASASVVGGILSRPFSNGIQGQTTVWFESLPADSAAIPSNNTITGSYSGAGRIPENYPRNTIGVSDSSEFNICKYFGVLSGIVVTNNTYASALPVLHPAANKNSLIPDGTSTSRTTYRASLDLQPLFSITESIQAGVDLNANYVSQKLIASDVNSFVTTPILKYAFDKKLNSQQYFFASFSYGIYDWKIKTLPDGSRTDQLWSTQSGLHFSL